MTVTSVDNWFLTKLNHEGYIGVNSDKDIG